MVEAQVAAKNITKKSIWKQIWATEQIWLRAAQVKQARGKTSTEDH